MDMKDVGEILSAYPSHQAFALPSSQDKQLQSAHAIVHYIV